MESVNYDTQTTVTPYRLLSVPLQSRHHLTAPAGNKPTCYKYLVHVDLLNF